jgi:hypothetical protein
VSEVGLPAWACLGRTADRHRPSAAVIPHPCSGRRAARVWAHVLCDLAPLSRLRLPVVQRNDRLEEVPSRSADRGMRKCSEPPSGIPTRRGCWTAGEGGSTRLEGPGADRLAVPMVASRRPGRRCPRWGNARREISDEQVGHVLTRIAVSADDARRCLRPQVDPASGMIVTKPCPNVRTGRRPWPTTVKGRCRPTPFPRRRTPDYAGRRTTCRL